MSSPEFSDPAPSLLERAKQLGVEVLAVISRRTPFFQEPAPEPVQRIDEFNT